MKKLLVATVLLLSLTACGKRASKEDLDPNKTIDTASILDKKDDIDQIKNKKIVFKAGEDGTQYTQFLTYKGKAYIKLVSEQVGPLNEELQNAVDQVGVEETTRLLRESTDKDADYKQASSLEGFSSQIEITADKKLKITNSFDLQKIKIDEMSKMPYFKGNNLKEILEMEPEKYLEARLSNGAQISDQ